MEKSLVDSKPNDPNAEPCENYENLPFHGLQNPPTKVRFLFVQYKYNIFFTHLTLIAVVTFLLALWVPQRCFDYCYSCSYTYFVFRLYLEIRFFYIDLYFSDLASSHLSSPFIFKVPLSFHPPFLPSTKGARGAQVSDTNPIYLIVFRKCFTFLLF